MRPGITADPATDERTRELGRWLTPVDEAVVSTTLIGTPWEDARVSADHASAVRTLRAGPGRAVLVLDSATLVQALLADDLVDDLRLTVVPVLLGGGVRLLPDGVSSSRSLMTSTTVADGAISTRPAGPAERCPGG